MQTKNELITEPIGLDPATLPKPMDWGVLFGNTNPVEIEIGCGQGHVPHRAGEGPAGGEFLRHRVGELVLAVHRDRLRRHGCMNARAVRAEAAFFLNEFVPAGSVACCTSISPTRGRRRGITSGG